MLETFIEIVVGRKNSFKDYALCFLLCIVPMLLGTYFVFVAYALNNSTLLILAALACALLYYLAYNIFNRFNVDWEYSLVSDEIRFSKIINKSKRRDIITVSLSKIDKVARINDSEHISSMRAHYDAKYSFVSQSTHDYYFITATDKKGRRVIIFFEPDERMCENFKTTLRGKFFI